MAKVKGEREELRIGRCGEWEENLYLHTLVGMKDAD